MNLGQLLSFERTCYGLPSRLLPPTFGARIFQHRIEMVHAHQPKLSFCAIHGRTVNATGSTHRAIGDEDVFPIDIVVNKVMIAQKLYRIGPGFIALNHANHQSVFIDLVRLDIEHCNGFGLFEHAIGGHHKIDHIKNRGKQSQHSGNDEFVFPFRAKQSEC